MAASVLNSPEAVEMSLLVVRALVRLRRLLAANQELAEELDALERRCNANFRVVFDAIRDLVAPPTARKSPIEFRADKGP